MADYRITIELVGKDQVSGVAGTVAGALGRIGEIASGILVAQVFERLASGIASMAREALSAGSYFQTLTIRMQNLLNMAALGAISEQKFGQALGGVSANAEEVLNWVRQVAVTTPFSVENIAATTSMALAMGFTEGEMKRMTNATVNFTAGMGLTDDAMWRIIYNFAQMRQQGKVTGTELRDLARGALVPITDVLHRMQSDLGMTNISFDKFHKLAAAGKVDVNAFFTAFSEIVEERMPDAAARMSETMVGVKNNIIDFIQAGLGGLVLKPMFDDLAKAGNAFIQSLLTPEIRAQLEGIGLNLKDIVQHVLALVSGWGDWTALDPAGWLETVHYWMSMLNLLLIELEDGNYEQMFKTLGFTDEQASTWSGYVADFINFKDAVLALPGQAQTFIDSLKEFMGQGENKVLQDISNFIADVTGMDTTQWIDFTNTINTLRDAFPVLAAWALTFWTVISDAFLSIWPTLQPALEQLHQAILNLITPEALATGGQIIGVLITVLTSLFIALLAIITGIINGVVTAFTILYQMVQQFQEHMAGFIDGMKELMSGNLVPGLLAIFGNLFAMIIDIFLGFFGFILGLVGGFIEGVVGFFQNLYERLVGHSIIPDMLNSIMDWFTTKFDELKGFLRDLIPDMIQAAKDLVDGLWQGFKDNWHKFIDGAKDLIKGLPDWVRRILGIASPSKVFMDIGKQISQGLLVGMQGGAGALQNQTLQTIQQNTFMVQPGFMFQSEDNFTRDMALLNFMYGGAA